MKATVHPTALRPGDVVAVAALSGGLDADEEALFEHGVLEIERLGFRVRVSPLVDRARHRWWSAASPAEIAGEFNTLLRDPEVRAIFALTGGRTTLSYLDLIDFDAVIADPIPLIGFSDIDAIHLALHARTGLVSMHADLVTHGFGYWHECEDARRAELADAYLRVLTGSSAPGALPSRDNWETWRHGRARGPLIGAMLNRLVRNQATPFALPAARFDGAILFWEEVGASAATVWNDLHVLRHAGVLDAISGMIVGPTATIEPVEGGPETIRELLIDVLGDRDIPVLANVDIGHDPPNIPLPIGVRAEIDADARAISLLEPAVVERSPADGVHGAVP
jgi:muramoyltetrapeptide carboxypeptidase